MSLFKIKKATVAIYFLGNFWKNWETFYLITLVGMAQQSSDQIFGLLRLERPMQILTKRGRDQIEMSVRSSVTRFGKIAFI